MEENNKNNEALKMGGEYTTVELILGIMFFGTIDLIALIIDLTGVGMAIAPFIQAGGNGVMYYWSWTKGDAAALRLGRMLTKLSVNIIPFLPTLTTVFIIETWLHNHPKATAVASKVAGKSKLAGTVAK